jgi:hypothetical protein
MSPQFCFLWRKMCLNMLNMLNMLNVIKYVKFTYKSNNRRLFVMLKIGAM